LIYFPWPVILHRYNEETAIPLILTTLHQQIKGLPPYVEEMVSLPFILESVVGTPLSQFSIENSTIEAKERSHNG
jgi:hypothetical protein